MARSPAERFVMGAEMFDSALAVVKESLPADFCSSEYKRQLFKRLYGLALSAWSAEAGANRRR
jgi:hypothetical protein